MIRVLLVDDEPIVRLALREMIDWEQYDCEIAGEAANGRDALRLMQEQQIDLAIVDIQMPIMTGIELVSRLKEIGREEETSVVVLSAYSNFQFVREAFLYGALDYIIKEDMSPDSIGAVLSRVIDPIKKKRAQRQRQVMESRDLLDRRKEQELQERLLNGKDEAGRGGELQVMEGLRHFMLQLLVDRPDADERRLPDESQSRFLVRAVRQVVESHSVHLVITPMAAGEYAALLGFPSSMGDQSIRELLPDILSRAIQQTKEYVDFSVTIGVSSPAGSSKIWGLRYEEACRQAGLRFYFGPGRVFFAESEPEPAVEAISSEWASVLERLAVGDWRWEQSAAHCFHRLKQPRGGRHEQLLEPYRALLWELGSLLYSKGLSWEAVMGALQVKPLARLEAFEHFEPLHHWLMELMRAACAQLDPLKQALDSAPRMTDKVKKWIDKHYGEAVSLSAASEMAGVSESYLSKTFAKETGETFIVYLTRKRIETAMQLMSSGMKLYEIAEHVGYPNQGYFSKMFKKITGKSPHEYREQQLSARR